MAPRQKYIRGGILAELKTMTRTLWQRFPNFYKEVGVGTKVGLDFRPQLPLTFCCSEIEYCES